MKRIRNLSLLAFAGLMAGFLGAARAFAQADYPNLQGEGERLGHNSDPINYNSGVSFLQWFNPSGFFYTTNMVEDNTDFANTAGFPNGPYLPNPYGACSETNPALWIAAPPLSSGLQEASPVFTEPAASQPFTLTIGGKPVPFPANYQPRYPDYYYAFTTPSAPGSDPTVAQNPAQLTAFQWSYNPQTTASHPIEYALYVWLPAGPTQTAANTYTFPQRYNVYQIIYGNNQRFVDVVDTYAAGTGWVRLGNGGLPTDAAFVSDGTHPIVIQLLNTIPRGANGSLANGPGEVVYADATMAVPILGTHNAAPTSAYVRDASGNPIPNPAGDPDIGGPSYFARIVEAINTLAPSQNPTTGNWSTVDQGQVKAYEMNPHMWPSVDAPEVFWTYTPSLNTPYAFNMVNGSPTSTFTADTKNPHYEGTNYYSAPLIDSAWTAEVDYQPLLTPGAYDIYVYDPGNGGGETYGFAVLYQIYEGAHAAYRGTLNEYAGGGWIKIGVRAYNDTSANALSVKITNETTHPDDVGKLAYANAVRFVASTNLQINSTPVIAQVPIVQAGGGGTTKMTQVVLVADENGKIHCLDYKGNSDGTTTEYWSYPSTPDPNNPTWTDPNLTSGIDGTPTSTVPVAQMPAQFNLSTAVVRNVGTSANKYRLFIASTNGRIYCLDMGGRGDYNTTTGLPGTTQRLWSYPDDFPVPVPKPTNLGAFRGSLVYGDAGDGLAGPTIFAAAPQGRVYSLDAVGNDDINGNPTNRTTFVNWTYPAKSNQPNLPPIEMTPALAFGNIYFGTLQDQNTGGPGTFYAINASSGKVNWAFNGLNNQDPFPNAPAVLDWVCGPATASAALLGESGGPPTNANMVYVLNQNTYLYGLNAANGQIATYSFTDAQGGPETVFYRTNELGITSASNLGFQWQTVYNLQTGVPKQMPCVVVPTSEGHVYSMFANVFDYNYYTDTFDGGSQPAFLLAWGYELTGNQMSAPAFSNKRMIVNGDSGFMYVFDNNSAGNGLEVLGNNPGQQVIAPNEPGPPDAFRFVKLRFLTQAGYQAMRQGTLTEAALVSGVYDKPLPKGQSTYAFEWGDTAYIAIYGFPFETEDAAGNTIVPPIVNVRLNVAGRVVRQLQVDSMQFASAPTSPGLFNPRNATWPSSWNSTVQDGYGVLAFTFQGGGANALPPGPGSVTADITTAALNALHGQLGPSQEIASDTGNTPVDNTEASAKRILNFGMANPIAVLVSNTRSAISSIGLTPNTYNNDALSNGSPGLGTITDLINADGTSQSTSPQVRTEFPNQLMQSLGFITDGTSGNITFNIYDRSDMAFIRPPGEGLDGVRFTQGDLAWQGGQTTIYHPLNPNGGPTLYPNFEDLPIDTPNDSLDYPNIAAGNLSFSVNPNGNAQNPELTGVTLDPPLVSNGAGGLRPMTDGDDPTQRVIQPTPVQITLNAPKYQPAVNVGVLGTPAGGANTDDLFSFLKADGQGDSAPLDEPQGYYGGLQVYVDSTGSGSWNSQDAYRTLFDAVAVPPTYRLHVDTPTTDLGTLAAGVGYSPLNPLQQPSVGGAFSPWNGPWNVVYQPFTLRSDSNINIVDMRLAKALDIPPFTVPPFSSPTPWAISSSSNDVNAWLDSSTDLWSNVDAQFGLFNPNTSSYNQVILPKPRVGDGAPTTLDTNPHPRYNPNLGVGSGAADLNPAYNFGGAAPLDGHTPLVAVSIPLGFPVGTYTAEGTTQLRLIEDTPISGNNLPQVWEPLNSGGDEPFSDPGINFSVTVGSTRLTTTNSPDSTPMADQIPTGQSTFTSYKNITPAALRDSFGTLIAAWASDRPTQAPTSQPSRQPTNDSTRIYLADVTNNTSYSLGFSKTGFSVSTTDPITGVAPSSPLRDLDAFVPASNSAWFADQNVSSATGYPANSLFGGTSIVSTEKYDLPAFPVNGEKDPLWAIDGGSSVFFSDTYMAFVGSAQIGSASGRLQESKVFVSPVTTNSSGVVNLAGQPPSTSDQPIVGPYLPAGMAHQVEDPLTAKGKPSLVQIRQGSGDEAFVFYPVTGANQTQIHMARFLGTGFTPYVSLNFGTGFDSVDSPSAILRPYLGMNPGLPAQLIDLTFSGKLRGRPTSEIYLGRLRVGKPADDSGNYHLVDSSNNDAEIPGAGSPFAFMSQQVNERLDSVGHGLYRARGVEWDRTSPVQLVQYINGQPVDLLDDQSANSTRYVDKESGLISYNSPLGGKVYLDPELGTVRFTTGIPSQNAEIRLTYTPAFLRISDGESAAYSEPTEVFDDHFLSDYTMWFNPQTNAAVGPADGVQSWRSMFFFGSAATGNGQTARPFMTTMRFGIRLQTPIATAANGAVQVTVTSNTGRRVGPYEVDPANGRIYFTAADEDNNVTVNYTGVDLATGNQIPGLTNTGNVSYVLEKSESPVQIDQAINEGSLFAFPDPFSYLSTATVHNERPPLVWMFFTSTRNGGPDIYFQTIAPSMTPLLKPAVSQ